MHDDPTTLSALQLSRRFAPYLRRHRASLALVLVAIGVKPLVDAGIVWMVKVMVDEVLVPADVERFWPVAAGFLALGAVGTLVDLVDALVTTRVAQQFEIDLRADLLAKMLELPPTFHDEHPRGDLLERVAGDVPAVEAMAVTGVVDAIADILRLAVFVVVLLLVRWELALVAFAAIPLFALTIRAFSPRLRRAARTRRRYSGRAMSSAEEALTNVAVVQAYDRSSDEVGLFHGNDRRRVAAELDRTWVRGLFDAAVAMIEFVATVAVFGLGAWQLAEGRVTLGGVLAFTSYLGRLYGPVRNLSGLAGSMQAARVGAERVLEVLDAPGLVHDHPGALPLPRARGEVCFRNVSFRYPGRDVDVLCGIDLTVHPGELVAVVGPSGAGKSTLAKLLLRLHEPSEGQVLLDGYDLRWLTARDIRRAIALVHQEPALFDRSIAANVAYGAPGAARPEAIRAALGAAALESTVAALPEGVDTSAGAGGNQLSGGQRRRVAVARAYARDAPVLVLDEPTTGLDRATAAELVRALLVLAQRRTALVITHEPELVAAAHRVVMLDGGRIVADVRRDRGTELAAAS